MNENRQNLTRKQLRAIPIIISARTVTEGVKLAGISKGVFYQWMKIEHFRQEFISQQNDLIETALKELKGLSTDAVEELGKLLKGTQNESIKLRAISLVIEYVLKMKELEDVELRLSALERNAEGKQ